MSLAALSGFVRRRWPRFAVALGFYTLTGRQTCIGITPGPRTTRVMLMPDTPKCAPEDFVSDSSIVLLLANRAAAETFVVGRSYWIDITPDL